jgi:hypothetical protein
VRFSVSVWPFSAPTKLKREQRLVAAVTAVVLDVIVDREIDHAVGAERRAPGHRPAGNPRVGLEDLPHIAQRIALEPCARERAPELVAALLDVVQIDEPVRGELRMHDYGLQRAGTVCNENTLCPARGPTATRCRR